MTTGGLFGGICVAHYFKYVYQYNRAICSSHSVDQVNIASRLKSLVCLFRALL